MPFSPRVKGAVLGLSAAALFGVSAPVSKLLLPSSTPLLLASLLYLGGGLGLSVLELLRRMRGPGVKAAEASIGRRDVPLLAGVILCGGILGPVLMLLGLQRMSGVAASLLLNLEGPFTILLALWVFGEHLGRSGTLAAGFIMAGAAVLGFQEGELRGDLMGMLALAGACLAWAVDNNLTQRLSLKDPLALVRIKALGSGTCTLVLAWMLGHPLPGAAVLGGALVLGFASYGLSIVLDAYALRLLGAAREAAYFATAPFVGALVSVPLLGERLRALDLVAGGLMATGVMLLLRERHGHEHTHATLEHEHLHVHDAHHQHPHPSGTPAAEPHSHPHHHAPLTHDHPHVSDLHHRHRH
ncbi:EamA family transporter [Corallococcus exiguus]|uniref:DMT family transporter n=1 Tax=Corallococcus exiguus TaxID=83462 RepID=UPI00149460A7|nr:EamA family transporter [Corallococcus exiguus]